MQIELEMMELIEASTIEDWRNDPYNGLVVIGPRYYWGKVDDKQRKIQINIKSDYSAWFEFFNMLFRNAPQDIKDKITETNELVRNWIEKESDWSIPATIEEAKLKFRESIGAFHELIGLIERAGEREIILVPDTNSLIIAPDLAKYSTIIDTDTYTIILVPAVLNELDLLKINHRNQDVRDKAKSVIRRIKGLRNQGSLLKGVIINKTVTVRSIAREPNFNETLHWLDSTNDDDRIIATVLEIQCLSPNSIAILVTSDINLQNKSEIISVRHKN